MTSASDARDVPPVAPGDLRRVMQRLIQDGNGLILLRGVNDETRATLQHVVGATLEGSSKPSLPVLLRVESLIAVFECRRMREVFLSEGLLIMPHLAHIAAHQRLNINWGFDRQRVLDQLKRALNATGQLRHAAQRATAGDVSIRAA